LQLEKMGREGRLVHAAAGHARLSQELTRLQPALEELVNSHSP